MALNSAFDLKLKQGECREEAFRRIFRGLEVAFIEIKSDIMSRSTGNVFIEFAQRGKPSGIAVSKSDYYAIETFPDRWILLRTAELKRIAGKVYRRNKRINPEYRGTDGGDNQNSGVLVPMSEFIRP